MTAVEVAARMGVGLTTLIHHLEQLRDAELLEVTVVAAGGTG